MAQPTHTVSVLSPDDLEQIQEITDDQIHITSGKKITFDNLKNQIKENLTPPQTTLTPSSTTTNLQIGNSNVVTIPIANNSTGGLLTALDKAKLDTVEPYAKDDQTPIEIKTALESLIGNNRLDASAIKNLNISAGSGDIITTLERTKLNNLKEYNEFTTVNPGIKFFGVQSEVSVANVSDATDTRYVITLDDFDSLKSASFAYEFINANNFHIKIIINNHSTINWNGTTAANYDLLINSNVTSYIPTNLNAQPYRLARYVQNYAFVTVIPAEKAIEYSYFKSQLVLEDVYASLFNLGETDPTLMFKITF